MSSSSQLIVKNLPQFNPIYYLAWASDVRDAFEDRGWTSYLIAPATPDPVAPSGTADQTELSTGESSTTTPAFKADPAIVSKARAFLKASIPYEYKHGLESFTTAAQIWTSLEQRYASISREDELRLKAQLTDFRKSRSDTIDQHILKFSALLSAVLAQQQPDKRFDNPDINSYFLRSSSVTHKKPLSASALHMLRASSYQSHFPQVHLASTMRPFMLPASASSKHNLSSRQIHCSSMPLQHQKPLFTSALFTTLPAA
jgi:gag-polypeptide of LTR copia-type